MSLNDGSIESIVSMAALSAISQPILKSLNEAYSIGSSQSIQRGVGGTIPFDEANKAQSRQLEVVNAFNKTTQSNLAAALLTAAALTDDDGSSANIETKIALALALAKSTFNKLRSSRKDLIISSAIYGAYNAGTYDSALSGSQKTGKALHKTWQSSNDTSVREAHRALDGQRIPISEEFDVGGNKIRFPKDPLALPSMTINCRCFLTFD